MFGCVLMIVSLQEQKRADKVIGHTLKVARKESGLTQVQVANQLGTTQSFVCEIEKGRRSLRVSEAIFYSYGIDMLPQELFERIVEALSKEGLLPS